MKIASMMSSSDRKRRSSSVSKGGSGGNTHSSSSSNSSSSNGNKIRIAVFGEHDVGKSALTVRYLTRRYIGEYKSNTDLLYRQTMKCNHATLDIEIVDISTIIEGPKTEERKTFPVEEIHRADGFIIVYSITNRGSFNFALNAVQDIYNYYNNSGTSSDSESSTSSTSSSSSASASSQNNNHSNSTTPTNPLEAPSRAPTCPVALIGNKNDLDHLRLVEKAEGLAAASKYGCQFYELSAAENSPEVYSAFQNIITTLSTQAQLHQRKRKFSVTKMLNNLRLGRSSSSSNIPVATSPASLVDTNVVTNVVNPMPNLYPYLPGTASVYYGAHQRSVSSKSRSASRSREGSPSPFSPFRASSVSSRKQGMSSHSRQGSSSSSDTGSTSSSGSFGTGGFGFHLKNRYFEFHSVKKRQLSPPICSL